MEQTIRADRATRRRRDLLMDRWIDLLAERYGMPRVALLVTLGTAPHLARAIAAIVAREQMPVPPVTDHTDEVFRRFAAGEWG